MATITTPASRIYIINREDKNCVINFENRKLIILLENRNSSFEKEDRTYKIKLCEDSN